LLKTLHHEREADGLQVVGIAVDYPAAVRKYAAARAIDYPVLVGEQGGLAAVSAFGMDTVLPFSVFADPGGGWSPSRWANCTATRPSSSSTASRRSAGDA